jgi:Fic-DOC domain mobile mystery protein B
VTDLFIEPEDATPLAPEERDGLRQNWITLRSELNAAEQDNIVSGATWARRPRTMRRELLDDGFARTLHERMFGDVWSWAGVYRLTPRNIGIDAHRIPNDTLMMFDDVRFWRDNNTFPPDEMAIRLHHRLVYIHPFPNGNGRHARLMADLLLERLGGQPFSWGGGTLHDVGELRGQYVGALRAADDHDIEPLLLFARS